MTSDKSPYSGWRLHGRYSLMVMLSCFSMASHRSVLAVESHLCNVIIWLYLISLLPPSPPPRRTDIQSHCCLGCSVPSSLHWGGWGSFTLLHTRFYSFFSSNVFLSTLLFKNKCSISEAKHAFIIVCLVSSASLHKLFIFLSRYIIGQDGDDKPLAQHTSVPPTYTNTNVQQNTITWQLVCRQLLNVTSPTHALLHVSVV